MSLAVARSTGSSITAYAGINSSTVEQDAGNPNRHLRSFLLDHPGRTQDAEKSIKSGKTTALTQTAFFKPSTASRKETYQRILRMSPYEEDSPKRIAAIASSLGTPEELVVLRADVAPDKSDEIARINLGSTEAADIDIHEADESGYFPLAYCTDTEVYTINVKNSQSEAQAKPFFCYGVPPPDAFNKTPGRPKLRNLRYISPRYLLLLRNRPQRSGADLVVLSLSERDSLSTVVLEKRLSKTTKSAISLDTCLLSSSQTGERQMVIAVASQSGSIEILTLDYSPKSGPGKFRTHSLFQDVGHPASITKLAFSTFVPPPIPVTKDTKPQYIKLASTSIAQTVVVHTLPLSPQPPTESTTPRYILTPPKSSEILQTTFSVTIALLVIGIAAFLLQAFTEIRGGVPPLLGATDWLSPGMRELIARPYMFAEDRSSAASIPVASTVPPRLQDMIVQGDDSEMPKAIVVRDRGTEISAEVRHDAEVVKDETLKRWEDLEEHQKVGWKKRLSDAGHWAESQGEAVLKGVFFSELAGVVGDFVRGP